MDAVLAQTLASRAYRALNRVCLGQARRVRFKSRGRGLGSLENKRPDTGLRFVLQPAEQGNAGYLLWQDDRLPALIDWEDPVVTYGLAHQIKYARLIVRQTSSPRARGADQGGQRYCVQLVLEGVPYHKSKHQVGSDTVGLDLGPSPIAIVPREGTPRLELLCAELAPDAQAIRCLQRQMERQRRANNPENYDERGRIKKRGKQCLKWKQSKRYLATRRRKATRERRLAAHRKSLHGRFVHEIVALGTTVITEKIAYRAWQKTFGKSVGLRAPGMLIALLQRTVARTGGTAGRAFPRTLPNSRSSVMAAASMPRNRSASAGTSVPVASQRSATSPERIFPPIWIQQILIPRVPNRGTPPVGKVGSPACGQHTSELFNARVRGSLCLAASVFPETERVCLKVQVSPHKSPPAVKRDGKRGSQARNLRGFSPERSQKGTYMTPNFANPTCRNISEGPNADWILDMGIGEVAANAQPVPPLKSPPRQLAWPYCKAGGDQDLSLRPGVADTEILFTSFAYALPPGQDLIAQLALLVISPDGKNDSITYLSPPDPNTIPLEPSWSPDGKYITYIRRENGQDNLYIMPIPDATITGTPNMVGGGPEVYYLEHGGKTTYYTNTTYYRQSQKLADGIYANPVWGDSTHMVFMKFDTTDNGGTFNLFLAKLKFAMPAAGPTGTPTGMPTTVPAAAVVSIDGPQAQLTKGGVDGESRPIWVQ